MALTIFKEQLAYSISIGTDETVQKEDYLTYGELPTSFDPCDYQTGVFGGVRFRKDRYGSPYLFCGEAHFNRWINHTEEAGILNSEKFPLNYKTFEEIAFKIRKANFAGDEKNDANYWRPRSFDNKLELGVGGEYGVELQMTTSHLGEYYPKGITMFLDFKPGSPRRTSFSTVGLRCKGANSTYAVGRKLVREAARRGGSDFVMLDDQGFVTDACTCNLLFSDGKKLVTPLLEGNALYGISIQYLQFIAEKYGLPFEVRKIEPAELASFKAMYTIGTAVGLTSVKQIVTDNGNIHEFGEDELSIAIADAFNTGIKERIEFTPNRFRMF